MRRQRRPYANGGPITPNYQTLGNIKFDSNKSREGSDGQMIVKDENTGKDFGVMRDGATGAYRFYSPRKKLQDNVPYTPINSLIKGLLDSSDKDFVNKLEPYLEKLSTLSTKRTDGKMTPEEVNLREDLNNKINPFTYNPKVVLGRLVAGKNIPEDQKMNRGEYLREYLGLPSKMKESAYRLDPNKPTVKPYVEWSGKKDTYSNNDIYETYRDVNDTSSVGKSKHNLSTTAGSKFGPLATYTLGRGLDNKGEYISIYDKWDIDPLSGHDNLKEIPGVPDLNSYNNPMEIYDRKYLSELSQAGRDSVYAADKRLGITPQDKRTNKATGGHLQENQMRKKRNYATGGYAGDPYQLALQQGMQVYPQYAAANNNGVPLANPNPFAPPEQAPNPYNTTNLPLTTQGSMQSVSRQSTPIIPEGLVGDTNNYAGDTTDVMGMAGGTAPLTLNPTNAPANLPPKSWSDGMKEKFDMLGKSGGNPYVLAAEMATKQIGDIAGAFSYKPVLGKEKTQSDKNMALAKGLISEGPIGLGVAALKNYKDKTTVVSGSPGVMPLHDPTFKEKTQRLFRGYAMGGSPGAYKNGGPISGPGTPRQPYINSSFAGTYQSPKRESMRVIPRPLQTPDFGAMARGYVASTEAERMQAIQSGNQAKVNELQNNAFNILDWANTERALGNYQRPTNFANGGMIDEDSNPNDSDDQQLSNSAFQVKGNPNVTDGNSYPSLNANLDHNEVVDKNAKFVFSNQLKNGKETFAKEAAEIYKRIGKVENRKDPISQATVQQLNKQVQTLAMSQEQLAQALGLRNDRPQGMAAGGFAEGPGPDPSTLIQVRDEKSPRTYYDPFNHKVFWKDTQGQFVDITGSGKFLTAIERSISGQPGTNPKSYFEEDPKNVITQKPFYSYPVPKNQILPGAPVAPLINKGIPVDNGYNPVNIDEFSQTKPQINSTRPARATTQPAKTAGTVAQQVIAPVSQQDSVRTMAGVTMDHERKSGLRDGTGDPRFGNPNLLPGATKEDALDWYMGNTYPQVKNKYPTAMEQSAAGDFLYNSGKDARVYAYQEYLKKTDPSNTGNWKDAQGNWKDRDTNSLPANFDQLYAATIGKLPPKQREDYINSGRTWYGKNTYKDDYVWGPGQGMSETDRTGKTVYRAPDGSVSPAYGNTWKGRIAKTSVYPTSTNPNTATTASRTPNSTVSNSKGLPWEGFDVDHFQQWYNSMPGSKIKNDKKWGTETKKAYEATAFDYMNLTGKNKVNNLGGQSVVDYANDEHTDVTPVNGKILPSSIGNVSKIPTKPIYIDTPEGQVDISELEGAIPTPKPAETVQDRLARTVDPYTGTVNRQGADPLIDPTKPVMDMTVPPTPETPYKQKTTVGDVMQGIDVGSKFFGLAQGPERESQIINNTPITKNAYDINPQLYQNQRNYRNTINSIGTSSAPQRRALSNQMLATKLNSDNGILEQGQNMNNQLNTQYEQLLGARRDRNIASQFQTNTINAANRGEYDNSVQNAFTSLGNFGQALNHQKTSNDVLELLQLNYPNVYKGVMSDWEEIKTGKKKKVVTTTDNTTTD